MKNEMIFLKAEEICKVIEGKKLLTIHRCLDLISIGFGDRLHTISKHGKTYQEAEYYLHLQCPFRFVDETGIILGWGNLYDTLPGHETVDLDEQNTSLFDMLLLEKNSEICGATVDRVEINSLGDISICLDSLSIKAFVTGNSEVEEWRFFRSGLKGPEVVVTGQGIEFDEIIL